jgi:hypothetical protein
MQVINLPLGEYPLKRPARGLGKESWNDYPWTAAMPNEVAELKVLCEPNAMHFMAIFT